MALSCFTAVRRPMAEAEQPVSYQQPSLLDVRRARKNFKSTLWLKVVRRWLIQDDTIQSLNFPWEIEVTECKEMHDFVGVVVLTMCLCKDKKV